MTPGRQTGDLTREPNAAAATLEPGSPGSECVVKVGGEWRLSAHVPSWTGLVGKHGVFSADSVAWDGKSYGQLAERLSEAISSVGKAIAADLPMEARTSVITTKKSKP